MLCPLGISKSRGKNGGFESANGSVRRPQTCISAPPVLLLFCLHVQPINARPEESQFATLPRSFVAAARVDRPKSIVLSADGAEPSGCGSGADPQRVGFG